MTRCRYTDCTTHSALCALLFLGALTGGPRSPAEEPTAAATAAFNAYTAALEARLVRQHQTPTGFLASAALGAGVKTRLRSGEIILERLTPAGGTELPGALLHHWRGTAFVPGATAADFERLMHDYSSYPQRFAPQVLAARVLQCRGSHVQMMMRVRQQHVLTVVMDTSYDILWGHLDARHGYSFSHSTRIAEIAAPGTRAEHALSPGEEHGFLWRLNTFWSYEERDGGLYMQIETVSLTRSIPTGLGWVVGPFVENVPRDSLDFTLRSVCKALRSQAH